MWWWWWWSWGAEMWGRQAAKYVCAANLTRTFEKAKSQRERCCLAMPHSKQPEPRLADVSTQRRTHNYHGKFYMLHLVNVVGRKIPCCPPSKKKKCWNICHVGCPSCCLAQTKRCLGFSISHLQLFIEGCTRVATITTISFTVTVYLEAQNDIYLEEKKNTTQLLSNSSHCESLHLIL